MASPSLAPASLFMPSGGRRRWLALAALVLGAAGVRLAVALALPTLHRPDEVFENLEPAFRLLTGSGVVTWEWHEGIRSYMFPAVLAGLMGLARAFGAGPAGYLAFVAAILSLVSAGTVAVGFDLGWRRAGLAGGLLCGLLCSLWPDLVYFGPKPLAEIQAGNLLIIGAYLAILSRAPGQAGWPVLATGLILGLVFCIRFHLAPAMFAVAVWSAWTSPRRWALLALGGIGPVAAYGVIDWVYWGVPFLSIWRNVQFNLVQAVSQEFGTQPVSWYASQVLSEWGGAIVPLCIAFFFGARQSPLLAAVAALVGLSHTAISHKEISFLYAAIPPFIVVCGLGTLDLVQRARASGRGVAVGAAAFWAATALATGLGGGFKGNWRADAGVIRAEQALSAASDLCGLGIRWPRVGWYRTGGDVFLGRGIPLYAFGTEAGVRRVAPAINYAIGGEDVAEGLAGFAVSQCWSDPEGPVCLAKAQRSTCQADPSFELNAVPGLGRMSTRFGADPPTSPPR